MSSITRSVVSGTAVLSFSSIGTKFLSVISVPILTALLAPAAYGYAAYVQSLVTIGSVIALMGIDMSYLRFHFGNDDEHRGNVEQFCWHTVLRNGIFFAILLFVLWHIVLTKHFDIPKNLGWFVAAGIILSVCGTMAQTRSRIRGGYQPLAIANFLSGLCSVFLSILIAWLWRNDVWAILLGTLAGQFLVLALLGIPPLISLVHRPEIHAPLRKQILMLGFAGTVTAPIAWVISSSDRWFIGYFHDQTTVGIYSVAYGIGNVGLIFNSAIVQAWIPEAIKLYTTVTGEESTQEIGKLWEILLVGMALGWLAVASFGGDLLRLLTNEKYHSGAVVIPLLAGGMFLLGVAYLANTGMLIANRMNLVAYVWAAGGTICLGLNYILVPSLGMIGAAISQFCAYLIIAVAVILISWRLFPMRIRKLKIIFLLLGIVVAGIVMAYAWDANHLLSIASKVPLCLIVMCASLKVIAPDWFDRVLNMCRAFSFLGL